MGSDYVFFKGYLIRFAGDLHYITIMHRLECGDADIDPKPTAK